MQIQRQGWGSPPCRFSGGVPDADADAIIITIIIMKEAQL